MPQIWGETAKHYGNVTPLYNTPAIKIWPLLELHLQIGPVNTWYDRLKKVWQRREDWLKLCKVKKVEYHGSKFEGNNSKELLRKTKQLEHLCPFNNKVRRFANTLKGSNDVLEVCYN